MKSTLVPSAGEKLIFLWKGDASLISKSPGGEPVAHLPDFSLSKNTESQKRRIGVLERKRKKEKKGRGKGGDLQHQIASFLRFMAANLSLTQQETRARPRRCV